MTLEREIENSFVDFAASQGCLSLKLAINGNRGFPDQTVFCPSSKLWHPHVFVAEVKKPGGVLSPQQVDWLDRLRAMGFGAYTFDNVEDGKRILLQELEKHERSSS